LSFWPIVTVGFSLRLHRLKTCATKTIIRILQEAHLARAIIINAGRVTQGPAFFVPGARKKIFGQARLLYQNLAINNARE
jgi:hypothetical protein